MTIHTFNSLQVHTQLEYLKARVTLDEINFYSDPANYTYQYVICRYYDLEEVRFYNEGIGWHCSVQIKYTDIQLMELIDQYTLVMHVVGKGPIMFRVTTLLAGKAEEINSSNSGQDMARFVRMHNQTGPWLLVGGTRVVADHDNNLYYANYNRKAPVGKIFGQSGGNAGTVVTDDYEVLRIAVVDKVSFI